MDKDEFIKCICKDDYLPFFKSDNVVAIGLGKKSMRGDNTDISCIQVYVKEKLPISALSTEKVIPNIYKGIITDVVASGDIEGYVLDSTVRPLRGGYALGRVNWNAMGTYGGPMERGNLANLKKCALSNNHVLGGLNTVLKGTLATQTAYAIEPTLANIIGDVRKYIPIIEETFVNSGTPINRVDAGLAIGNDNNIFANLIQGIGEIKDLGIPKIGMQIIKTGRTTETTTGVLTNIGATVRLVMNGSNFFVDQLIGNINGAGGDSGALMFEKDTNKLLGLLFSGGGSIVVFNDIRNVLSLLGIRPPINNWGVN